MHSSLAIHNHLKNSWHLTLNAQKIRRFNVVGSIFDTIILSVTFIYQVGIVWVDVMHKESEFFSWFKEFFGGIFGQHGAQMIVGLFLVGIAYFLTTFLIKNIFNAGLIHLIRAYHKRDEKQYSIARAIAFGWKKSIKLAEYHSLLFWSKPVYIISIFYWGYTWLHASWATICLLAGIFIVVLILTRFFFEYARLFIIVQDTGVFAALGLSMTMALENIRVTARLFFALILVYLREIVLLIGIFCLPFIISGLVAMGIGPIFLQGAFILIGLVYFAFLIIVSAMNSVIEIFVESLWYSVFLDNLDSESHEQHNHTEEHVIHSHH